MAKNILFSMLLVSAVRLNSYAEKEIINNNTATNNNNDIITYIVIIIIIIKTSDVL